MKVFDKAIETNPQDSAAGPVKELL